MIFFLIIFFFYLFQPRLDSESRDDVVGPLHFLLDFFQRNLYAFYFVQHIILEQKRLKMLEIGDFGPLKTANSAWDSISFFECKVPGKMPFWGALVKMIWNSKFSQRPYNITSLSNLNFLFIFLNINSIISQGIVF